MRAHWSVLTLCRLWQCAPDRPSNWEGSSGVWPQRSLRSSASRGTSRETLGEGVTSRQREQQMQDEPRARFVLLLINGAPPQQRLKLLVLNPESASPNLGPYFPETEIFDSRFWWVFITFVSLVWSLGDHRIHSHAFLGHSSN